MDASRWRWKTIEWAHGVVRERVLLGGGEARTLKSEGGAPVHLPHPWTCLCGAVMPLMAYAHLAGAAPYGDMRARGVGRGGLPTVGHAGGSGHFTRVIVGTTVTTHTHRRNRRASSHIYKTCAYTVPRFKMDVTAAATHNC